MTHSTHRRRALAGSAALAVALTTVGLAIGPSAAGYGEAVIEPVETDLAGKAWVTAHATSNDADAGRALDDDEGTAWTPSDRTASGAHGKQSLTVDLGGAYDGLHKVEVVLADAAPARYVVETSTDRKRWVTVADHNDGRSGAAGTTALVDSEGTRYLRVRFAATNAGTGVAEVHAYNYLREDLVLGADLSYADQERDQPYYLDAEAALAGEPDPGPHLLDVVKDRGMEHLRLRIWNDPRDEGTGVETDPAYQGPERSLTVAREVVDHDMSLGIDFHYADSWADPSKQPKPRAWAELPFDELTQEVHDFTADYLTQLAEQGTTPAKVAVGNEVINGFLYGSEAQIIGTTAPQYFVDEADVYQSQPGGGLLWDYWRSEDPAEQQAYTEQWDRFATLMASGINAVREASPESEVEIHAIVDTGRLDKTMEFWTQLLTRLEAADAAPDVLALSYYPQWHGSPEDLEHNLYTIAEAFPEYALDVAETAYPAESWPPGDPTPLPNSPFPVTVQGQADAIQRVFQVANDVPGNRVQGVLVWEPANWQPMFTWVETDAGWFPEANASLDVYRDSDVTHVLEDSVHVVTEVDDDVRLPRTVGVLSPGDGLARTRVAWQDVPDDATATPGTFTVDGTTKYGPVTATIHVVPNR
ncbi:arabinogalactan endo-1,4-beta-galactosidase [Promicromonospora sp. AC04]|uniref:glycosyl hydrolase 53 family protein n=1 Tax=Promicromonospora sp. AC04 TaxID=2135723 RepID=UPI000D468266|nr:glycosyl hydrolase 53 family protein [Promicromonospora sp. AC04]PUB29881.1 arabinogalactan endo-1,4-beta-galactosidase [Promicromonospora sp. AC04]